MKSMTVKIQHPDTFTPIGMLWIHCTKFSRQTQLIFANCTIFFQKNSISHHHFIHQSSKFVSIVVTVSILLNISNISRRLLTILNTFPHLSPNYRVQFALCSSPPVRNQLPHHTDFLLRGLEGCYNIAIGDCKGTPTLIFRQACADGISSGVAFRPK